MYNSRLAKALEKYGGGNKARDRRKSMQRRSVYRYNDGASVSSEVSSIDSDEQRMSPHYKEYIMNIEAIKTHLARKGEFEGVDEEALDSPSTRGDKLLRRINKIENSLTREVMFQDLRKLNVEEAAEVQSDAFDAIEGDNWVDNLPSPRVPTEKGLLPPSFKKPEGMLEALSTPAFQSNLYRHPLTRGNWKPSGKEKKKMSYVPKGKTKNQVFGKDGKPIVTQKPMGDDTSTDNVTPEANAMHPSYSEESRGVEKKQPPAQSDEALQQQKDLEELKAKIKRVRVHSFKPSDRFGNKDVREKCSGRFYVFLRG